MKYYVYSESKAITCHFWNFTSSKTKTLPLQKNHLVRWARWAPTIQLYLAPNEVFSSKLCQPYRVETTNPEKDPYEPISLSDMSGLRCRNAQSRSSNPAGIADVFKRQILGSPLYPEKVTEAGSPLRFPYTLKSLDMKRPFSIWPGLFFCDCNSLKVLRLVWRLGRRGTPRYQASAHICSGSRWHLQSTSSLEVRFFPFFWDQNGIIKKDIQEIVSPNLFVWRILRITPRKTNMSPENQWLEDVFPIKIVLF